jgi:putative restriction endonuclease
MAIFNSELQNPNTKFFILDTGRIEHRDIDFEMYSWNKHRYNLMNPGDLFIYRKPQKVSENGKFYFFGAGKIEQISEVAPEALNFKQPGDLEASISKPILFDQFLYQDQIHPTELKDTRKEKDDSWNHFFNNYGMNQIDSDVFSFLLSKGLGKQQQVDTETNELRVAVHKQVLQRNHEVSNSEATVKTRGKYQRIFREDIVLPNYDYECAITGIKTLSLLRAAHIVRWADNKKERLNPQNGICLSVLADACFEKGFITIDSNYKVQVSEKAKKDPALFEEIARYDGLKINLPKLKENRPAKRFLLEHQNRVS